MTTAFSPIRVLVLLGAIIVIVILIWMGWRFWHKRSMKVTLGCLGLSFFLVFLWIGWNFQPWMPTGRPVYIRSEHLGDYDFQVWQRKTDIASEPFATGLFARRHGGPWRVYLLDWQDVYRSTIVLREREASVEVFQDGRRVGVFDETQQMFNRDSNGESYPGEVLDAVPPGSWYKKND